MPKQQPLFCILFVASVRVPVVASEILIISGLDAVCFASCDRHGAIGRTQVDGFGRDAGDIDRIDNEAAVREQKYRIHL